VWNEDSGFDDGLSSTFGGDLGDVVAREWAAEREREESEEGRARARAAMAYRSRESAELPPSRHEQPGSVELGARPGGSQVPSSTSLAPVHQDVAAPEGLVLELLDLASSLRAAPNSMLRGALFPAIGRMTRPIIDNFVKVATQDGIDLYFRGRLLDQSDLDVFLTVLQLARKYGTHSAAGTILLLQPYPLMVALGRQAGKNAQQWLEDALDRLLHAQIKLEDKRHRFAGSLLAQFKMPLQEKGPYEIVISRDLYRLFDADFTKIQWAERQALRGSPLALWLHGYFCTHSAAKLYPLKIETIHAWCGSRNKNMRDFGRELIEALELVRTKTKAINSWEITTDKRRVGERRLKVTRAAPASKVA
jgi:hypothetical protein